MRSTLDFARDTIGAGVHSVWIVVIVGSAILVFAILRRFQHGSYNKGNIGTKESSQIRESVGQSGEAGDVIPVGKTRDLFAEIPADVRNVLFISDGEPKSFGISITISVDIDAEKVTFDKQQPDDPTTIYVRQPIMTPGDSFSVPGLSYYPSYAELEPEQKWIYLDWLCDVEKPIDIGYVFIFYYGLERRLLLEDFDSAFDMIQRLRLYHHNASFQTYCLRGLLYGTVLRNRSDRIPDLGYAMDNETWDDEQLLICARMRRSVEHDDLARVIAGVSTLNRRYLKQNRDVYVQTLAQVMHERFGSRGLDLNDLFPAEGLEKHSKVLFANYTFPEAVRSLRVPSYTSDSRFMKELTALHEASHTKTKEVLKARRSKK